MELLLELLNSYEEEHFYERPLSNTSDLKTILDGECYKALREIRQIIRNNALDDVDCFEMIEKIVCLLEEKGINCGGRHDFG